MEIAEVDGVEDIDCVCDELAETDAEEEIVVVGKADEDKESVANELAEADADDDVVLEN